PKNCTHCYRRSGVQFRLEATPLHGPTAKPPFGSRLILSDRFYTPTLIRFRPIGLLRERVMRAARTLFAATFTALGLLGLAGPSCADTITGILIVGGFSDNVFDPNNALVPATIPPSAYTGFSNASSPTVTITSFPITFGFNCSSCND